jgi:hypothetical protein
MTIHFVGAVLEDRKLANRAVARAPQHIYFKQDKVSQREYLRKEIKHSLELTSLGMLCNGPSTVVRKTDSIVSPTSQTKTRSVTLSKKSVFPGKIILTCQAVPWISLNDTDHMLCTPSCGHYYPLPNVQELGFLAHYHDHKLVLYV